MKRERRNEMFQVSAEQQPAHDPESKVIYTPVSRNEMPLVAFKLQLQVVIQVA